MKVSLFISVLIFTLHSCDGQGVRPPLGIEEEQQQRMEQDKEKDPREMDETEQKDQQRREVNVHDVNFTPANQ
jgi:hypothetical protein